MEGLSVDMAGAAARDHKGFQKPIFGQGQSPYRPKPLVSGSTRFYLM